MKIDTREFIQLRLMRKKYGSTKFFDLKKKQEKRYMQLVGLLCDQVYWEKANDFLKIVDSFCNNEMTIEDFQTEFCALRILAIRNYDRLVELLEQDVLSNELTLTKLEINPKSRGFGTAIDEPILHLIDMYDPHVTLEENLTNKVTVCLCSARIQQIMNDTIRPKLEKYRDK